MSPIFRPGPGPYALALAMTGVRLGERLLYIGSGTPAMFGALAGKVGLTGRAVGVVGRKEEAQALTTAAEQAGVLVEVSQAAPTALAFDPESFDLVVVDSTMGGADQAAGWLREAHRVLRNGGRLIVAERTHGSGLLGGLLKSGGQGKADTALRLLDGAGLRPARIIAERDGWRFTEGLKR